jgi:hypothetical protein
MSRQLRIVLVGALWMYGCKSSPVPTTPTQSPTVPAFKESRLEIEVWETSASRESPTGAYLYDVRYRFQNIGTQSMTGGVTGLVLTADDAQLLGGTFRSGSPPAALAVPPLGFSEWNTFTIIDTDISHPFADRLHLTVDYQVAGSSTASAGVDARVLHGPQTARVFSFTVTPANPTVGGSVTVSWHVESAIQVFLDTTLPRNPAANQGTFAAVVEPIGSRTFVVNVAGAHVTYLRLDRDAFRLQQASVAR